MRSIASMMLGVFLLVVWPVHAQVGRPVLEEVERQRDPLIETMKELVSIESGSRDFEGLSTIAGVIGGRLEELGGDVEFVDPADVYSMQDTPDRIGRSVVARFRGAGSRRILLLAHMDTVYLKACLLSSRSELKVIELSAWALLMTNTVLP